MGVKNLWDILEPCKKKIPLPHLQSKRVCIDLSCWMVQLENVNRSYCASKDKVYLRGLFYRLRALIALNCTIIFVTDGSIPAIKLSTYRRRLTTGNQATFEAENPQELKSLKRNMGSEFSCIVKEAKSLGCALGIPCLDGIEEAEAQCALLNYESLCDGCFTSDSDGFLFGARTVYRDICLGEGGYVVCYEMDDIERKLGYGRNSLIALALLLGSDYTHGVRGVGPESACQIVKSIGDSAVLQQFSLEGFSIAKYKKSLKNQKPRFEGKENNHHGRDYNGDKCNLPADKQILKQVIDAYMKPKCHTADSAAVNRVLPMYPINCTQLHQVCGQFFDWSPEKTDEYILPKIAERDLRRYANLRSTSSALGVHLPLNEIPVKCPVSGIVKPRKCQGRDYFEVSWENIDGLKTSAVPADLVESACPEKILEFQQRKAQKQKPTRRPRQKKVNTSAEMVQIDEKLEDLLLDIERESTAANTTSVLNGLLADKMSTDTHVVSETSYNSGTSTSGCYSTSSSYFETDIIDLVSPSPQVRARFISKCENTAFKHMEVIELSESEHEVSPEHVRKVLELSESEPEASPEHARKVLELRKFISSIRNEM